MTEEPAPIPLRDELTARERYALAFHGLLVLGSVPDTAVALVRWARRERGVQLGPTLVTLLLSAALPRPGRAALRTPGRRGVAVRVVSACALVLPVALAVARRRREGLSAA